MALPHTRNPGSQQLTWRPTAGECWAGVAAGTAAGVLMSVAMALRSVLTGTSPWVNPNLVAVMWLGRDAVSSELTAATAAGLATHMVTSAVMGLVAVPFIYRLPGWRTMLAAFAYALGSYPLVFAMVMTWLNPLFVRHVVRSELVLLAAGHALFGLVLGGSYLGLRRHSLETSSGCA